MTDLLYREIILEHWAHPQNYGTLDHPDIDVTQVNPLCGDQIHITARIKDHKIAAISFTSTGCAISTASASLLTTMVTGMPIKQFITMTPEAFLKKFEIGFSPVRVKCALLSFFTLQQSLKSKPTPASPRRPQRESVPG